jgi:hypothetical protein
VVKSNPACGVFLELTNETPSVGKHHPIGENSPNLVTLQSATLIAILVTDDQGSENSLVNV